MDLTIGKPPQTAASYSRFTPFLPLIGTPGLSFSNNFLPRFDFKKKVKLQPLYVGDLVKFLIGVSLKKKNLMRLSDLLLERLMRFLILFWLQRRGREFIFLYLLLLLTRWHYLQNCCPTQS